MTNDLETERRVSLKERIASKSILEADKIGFLNELNAYLGKDIDKTLNKQKRPSKLKLVWMAFLSYFS